MQSYIVMTTVIYMVIIAILIILAIFKGKHTGHGWRKELNTYLKESWIILSLITVGMIVVWIIPFVE